MRQFAAILLVATIFTAAGCASEQEEWDQQKARAKVQQVLEVEKQGLPWEDIDWMTDTKAAINKARELNKPIFAFLFMKTEVGPPEAPC